jgi:hypothetical protein
MANVDGPVVAFLIGMRINALWRVWEWLPVVLAMPKMLRELAVNPALGGLGARTFVSGRVIMVVQYWRSFEDLEHYARAAEHAHLPAWKAFNARARRGTRSTGIFHETYLVAPGQVESVYVDMPQDFGLAGAVGTIDVRAGKIAARERLAADRSGAL